MNALRLTRSAGDAARLAEILQDAVDLLRAARVSDPADTEVPRLEPSLLQQCLDLCSAQHDVRREPVRTIHHFACTGGTLISKCVAAMPNVQLLSEIDPLSTHGRRAGTPTFAPTDLLTRLAEGTRPVPREGLLDVFHSQMQVAYEQTRRVGGYLVLRDHTHSHFCFEPCPDLRPTLREILSERHELRSVVTVRDPVDSFMSLHRNGWVHFRPATFDEYCRRYQSFLDRYRDCVIVRYEDFVENPKPAMRRICAVLELPYNDMFEVLFPVFRLTGDSGRTAAIIAPRETSVDEAMQEAIRIAPGYPQLAERLGYAVRRQGEG